MITATLYAMPQTVHLALSELSGSTLRSHPVARCDFALTRAVTNEVDVFVKTIDRKPAAPGALVLRVLDTRAQTVLLETPMVLFDAGQGIHRLTLTPDQTASLPLGSFTYTVTATRPDGATVMLYTDRNHTQTGTLAILPGPTMTPPPAFGILPGDWLSNGPDWQTGSFPAAPGGVNTMAAYLTGYSGVLAVQASLEAQPSAAGVDWFDVAAQGFSGATGTFGLTAEGNFRWLRVVRRPPPPPVPPLGSVDRILLKTR